MDAVRALDASGVEWMLTGSMASSILGRPRATHDVDVIVDISYRDVPAITKAFAEPRFFLQESMVRDAVAHGAMFNVIDTASSGKIDCWCLRDEPFNSSQFARRRAVELPEGRIWVISPEDLILQKLHWARQLGGSEKQFADCVGVYEMQARTLDRAYMDHWAERLGLTADWRKVQAESEPL